MELLQDSVAFPRSAAAPAAQDRVPLRRVMGVVTLAWMFGSVWSTTTTGEPLTLFAQKLGASNFQFGLLAALPFVASLMSVPGSLLIESTGNRKQVFLWSFYFQRAMWFLIGLAPFWMMTRYGAASAGGALAVFLGLIFVMYAVGAMGGPAWVSWMADVVPPRLNGKYFSRRRQWGNLTAIPAAIVVGWFLDHCVPGDNLSILRWCAILFLCCAVCGLTDIHLFQYVPAVPKPRQQASRVLAALKEPLANRQFLRYSAFVGVLTFAVNLLGQFATLYLLEQVGVTNMAVQMILVVAPMIGQLLVLGVWGRAADRMGKRPLLVLASTGLVPVGIAWCFVTPGRVWLGYLLSALGAALWTGIEVVNLNLILETSGAKGPRQGGSSYAAVNSVIINVAGCLGGLTAGILAQLLREWHWQPLPGWKTLRFYDVLFIASGFVRLGAAMIFIPLLDEPAARTTRHTLRFMGAALAALLISAPLQPLRMLGIRRRSVEVIDIAQPLPITPPASPPLRRCA